MAPDSGWCCRGNSNQLKENVSMGKIWVAVRFLLVASALTLCLSACGGSGSSSPAASISTSKTASWTNVSVRSLDGKVNINWDKAASKTGTAVSTYNVYCSTTPTDIKQDKNRVATGYAGTSFDHTDVTNGQRYYYVVTEVNGAGEGAASRIVSATPDAVRPAPPSGLSVTAKDSLALLEWKLPTPADPASVTYNLYRSVTRNSFTATNIIIPNIDISKAATSATTTIAISADKATTTITCSDANLVNGTTYYYAITAVVAGKESAFSSVVSAQPQTKVAAVNSSATTLAVFASPAKMSAGAGNGSIIVKWSDVGTVLIALPDTAAPGATVTPYYTIYWSDSPDVIARKIGKIDDAAKTLTKDASGDFTFTLTGLTNGATYYLQVAAAVKGADGLPIAGRYTAGPVVSITPSLIIPAIPGGVSATQGAGQVLLAWNKVTWSKDAATTVDATYNIYVSTTDANSPAELMAKGVKKNNDDSSKAFYTHTGLEAGKTYYYVVTAVGEGESAPSSIVAVTL
jgi:fibronectin type 3 domain-containing protein